VQQDKNIAPRDMTQFCLAGVQTTDTTPTPVDLVYVIGKKTASVSALSVFNDYKTPVAALCVSVVDNDKLEGDRVVCSYFYHNPADNYCQVQGSYSTARNGGSSGSPVLVYNEGKWMLLGLHVASGHTAQTNGYLVLKPFLVLGPLPSVLE
jgi:hypothetical protein